LQHCTRFVACDGLSLSQHALLTSSGWISVTRSFCSGYFCIPAGTTAVRAECRRSAYLLSPDVRTHHSTAKGASLVARPGANPVPVVCYGVPLYARHSTGVPVRQSAADFRDRRSSLTPPNCRCYQLVGLPLATAPLQWLQRGHGTVCHQRLGPAPHS